MRYFALLAVMTGLAYAADTTETSQTFLEIKVCQQEPDDNSVLVRANQTLAVNMDRPFQFNAGGTIKPKHTKDEIPIGTRINGKLQSQRSGACELALTIQIAEQRDVADEEMDLVQSETIDLRTVIAVGQTKRVVYSVGKSIEITLSNSDG